MANDPTRPSPANYLTFPPISGDCLVVPLKVIDGDSIKYAFLVEDTGRLFGLNTPELHGPDAARGLAARQFLQAELPVGVIVAARLHGREKFGRSLIELIRPDGKSVNQLLLDAGHAKPWLGQGARPT